MKIFKYLFFTITALLIISCEETDEIDDPVACILSYTELENGTLKQQTTFEVFDKVTFKVCGEAELYVVWVGDEAHNYDLDHGGENANNGFAIDSDTGIFEYEYPVPGTFKVVVIATNTQVAGEKKQSMTTFDLVITE